MIDSQIEAVLLDEMSDSNESCSETEDYIEEAEPSGSSDSDSESVLVPTMTSKNGQIKYSRNPVTQSCGRASRENIINLIPGLTRYSCSQITLEEKSSFQYFFPPLINTKFTPIRDLWNQGVDLLPKFYNPSENVTVDEQLVAFRGRCPFRVHAVETN